MMDDLKLTAPSPETLQTAIVVHLAEEFSTAYANADFSEEIEVRELDRAAAELRGAITKLRDLQATSVPSPEV